MRLNGRSAPGNGYGAPETGHNLFIGTVVLAIEALEDAVLVALTSEI